jgi:hypothetical protein
MGRDKARAVVDVDPIFGLAHLELAADERIRHRVAVGVHIDIALDVDETMMERVHLRHEERQWPQVRPFSGEEFPRTRVQMPFGGGVHLVAESARLGIEIGEIGKRAPGEKVVLDKMKGSLDAGRSVRIALLMRPEHEAKALGEGGHLRRRHHPRARASRDDDVRIVDQAGRGRPGHVLERVGEEGLAIETREDRVGLEEEQARVAQHQRGRLDALVHAADRGAVRRGVVLHLLRGREVVVADGRRRRVADRMPPAERGQRRVGDRDALGDELFVDTDQIAAAAIDPLQNLVAVRLRFLGSFNPRHRRAARLEHGPHRSPRDPEGAGNLADSVALRL